jgi:hypothetical protein
MKNNTLIKYLLALFFLAAPFEIFAQLEGWDERFGEAGANQRVDVISVDGTDVYAGGIFTVIGRVQTNHVARWDGVNWHDLAGGLTGPTLTDVSDMIFVDGDLYVAGTFSEAGGVSANHVARWDGTRWFSLGSGISDSSSAMNLADVYAITSVGSEIYVAGSFDGAGGVSVNNIARWDGQGWKALGEGVNGTVWDLESFGDLLYVGGNFTQAGGTRS